MVPVMPLISWASQSSVSQPQKWGVFLNSWNYEWDTMTEIEKRATNFDKRIAPILRAMEMSPIIEDTTTTAKRVRAILRQIIRLLWPDFSVVPNQSLLAMTFAETDRDYLLFRGFSDAVFAMTSDSPVSSDEFYTSNIGILWNNHLVTLYGTKEWFERKSTYLFVAQKIQSTIDTLEKILNKWIEAREKNFLMEKNNILEDNNRILMKTSITDTLTGVCNRLSMNEMIQMLRLNNTPVHCIIIDIDYFKRVNDIHGHGAWDDILKDVSRALTLEWESFFGLKPSERLYEIAGHHNNCSFFRMGGEEFCFLITGISDEAAYLFAEHIRSHIANREFLFSIQWPPSDIWAAEVTISLWVSYAPDSSKIPFIIKQADIALYQAKWRWRNQVVVFSPELDPPKADLPNAYTHATAEDRREVRAGI